VRVKKKITGCDRKSGAPYNDTVKSKSRDSKGWNKESERTERQS